MKTGSLVWACALTLFVMVGCTDDETPGVTPDGTDGGDANTQTGDGGKLDFELTD